MKNLEEAVRAALLELDLSKRDWGAARLAVAYARAIDQRSCPECASKRAVLDELGPKLLTVLDALLLTPKSRAVRAKGGVTDEPVKSPLDELRAKRAARAGRTEAMDA